MPRPSTRARSSRSAAPSATPPKDIHPRDWVGTVTPSQLAFPYLVNWGYPERFHRQQSEDETRIEGIAGSPGTIEGTARVVMTTDEFDQVRDGDILVCQMTNPAWVVLFTKIAGLVTDTGGTTSHPAVLSREFGIPAVIGTSIATKRIRTGDRIRVDGTKGVVEVLEAAGSAAPTPRPRRSARDGRHPPAVAGVRRGPVPHPVRRARLGTGRGRLAGQGLPGLSTRRRRDRAAAHALDAPNIVWERDAEEVDRIRRSLDDLPRRLGVRPDPEGPRDDARFAPRGEASTRSTPRPFGIATRRCSSSVASRTTANPWVRSRPASAARSSSRPRRP